jgi:UDP:flavonoid glycosyltransferase YjiC (YdhE family)
MTRTGVPQVILPQWIDLYNFAQLVEDINVGVWGCRETSPNFTPDCLAYSIRKVATDSDASLAMRKKAQQLAQTTKENPGQYIAADGIAKLAASGKAF